MNVSKLFAVSGHRSLDEAEEDLGKPEPLEESDLRLHVARCAKRWTFSYVQGRETKRAVDQLRVLVLLVVILTLVNARPEIAKAIAGVLELP